MILLFDSFYLLETSLNMNLVIVQTPLFFFVLSTLSNSYDIAAHLVEDLLINASLLMQLFMQEYVLYALSIFTHIICILITLCFIILKI